MIPTNERQFVALSLPIKERVNKVYSPSVVSPKSSINIVEADITNELPEMENYVFLVDTNKQPLAPITPKRARELLTKGKAAVWRMYPFTLILHHAVPQPQNPFLHLKIDPGSKTTGLALLDGDKVIWAGNLEHRGERIKDVLAWRRAVRRNRRQRKTRYRPARFDNRQRKDGWLAPSLMHRVQTIETWVKRLCRYAPIAQLSMELVRFDTQKMVNPEISGVEYQQGELWGYEVKEYLLTKWGRQCVYCGKKDVPLEVEHIQPKSKGGSDRVSNLTIACRCCNQKKGNIPIEEFLQKKPQLLARIIQQAKTPLKDAASVNSTRWKLFETLNSLLDVNTGTGGMIKMNRMTAGLPKDHWIDAACVGVMQSQPILKTCQPLLIKAKGRGSRQKAALNKYGYPIRHNPLKPILGWLAGDLACHWQYGIGRVTPRSKGSFVLTLIDRTQKSVKHKDLHPVFRRDGYAYAFYSPLPSVAGIYR